MLLIRSCYVQKVLSHGITTASQALQTRSQSTSKLAMSILRINLSRSRPLTPARPSQFSRLPADGHFSTAARLFSSSPLSDQDVKRKVEDISEKFKEAMELLDDARGSMGTVYFSEDMTDAESAIQNVLSDYESLMKQMNEEQTRTVQRTIGLKMEELKAQVQMLKDSLKE